MNSENDLIKRLMVSKKIMEKHDKMGRGSQDPFNSTPMLENYQPVNASYNIPQDILQEEQVRRPQQVNNEVPTADRIANSKLPDEIKRLMMEHPIAQPTSSLGGPTLSTDLIDKAARLMAVDASGKQVSETPRRKENINENLNTPNNTGLKEMLREVVEEVLYENGLIMESESKSNEMFKFRVGDHIFEGKVTKIRKVSK
jgi:hypothetical protein